MPAPALGRVAPPSTYSRREDNRETTLGRSHQVKPWNCSPVRVTEPQLPRRLR